ncbi:MAG: DUF1330 domain-containing protein [Gammaproteobacteria bacterium]
MTAYVVVHATVLDQNKMQEYGAAAGPTVTSHGGKVVSRGPSEVLAGESPHQVMVVLEFPSRQAAADWYASEEYQAIIPTRLAAMDSVFVLGGE